MSETKAEKDQLLLARIKQRYEDGIAFNEENRKLHTEDLRMVYDSETSAQWDPQVLALRQGRPSYTVNRLIQPVSLVLGDQLQNCPGVKFRPSTDGATSEVAEIFGGLWRSIEQDSRADAIYGQTFKHCVAGGFGELRLVPEFRDARSFEQVLRIKPISNPLTVIRDPEATDPCGADAMWCMVGDRISKDKHEALYPKADMTSFDMSRDSFGWATDKEVRVVEYFERIPVENTIAELSDGRVIDFTSEERRVEQHLKETNPDGDYAKVVRTRKVTAWKVRWLKCNGSEILDGPIDYDWDIIPIIRMPGRFINIEGKIKLQSLVRHSKDPQRLYNFYTSDAVERSAQTPKSQYFATAKMTAGYEDIYKTMHTSPRPVVPFNVDKDNTTNGGAPFRVDPVDMPQGTLSLAQKAVGDLQASIGMFDAAMGNSDDMNRVSGKALVQHTRRSDLGSYEFMDGYRQAVELLARCSVKMIPSVYDTKRIERAIGGDGSEKNVAINQPGENGDILNDLKAGSYDVTVTLGPSYQSERQEALGTWISAAQAVPQIGQVAPDIIASNIDSKDADEVARRLRKPLIAQGIIEPTDAEKKSMPPPAPPDPMHAAELQRAQALAAKDTANAHIATSKANADGLEHAKLVADLVSKHLDNILNAQKAHAGNPNVIAAQVQAEAAQPAPVQ